MGREYSFLSQSFATVRKLKVNISHLKNNIGVIVEGQAELVKAFSGHGMQLVSRSDF